MDESLRISLKRKEKNGELHIFLFMYSNNKTFLLYLNNNN